MTLFFKDDEKEALECPHCGYKIVAPYPKDKLCPKCGNNFLEIKEPIKKGKKKKKKEKKKKEKKDSEETPSQPKEIEAKPVSLASKLEGKVKVKKTTAAQDLTIKGGDRIDLQKGEYIKLLGVTSVERTPLFCFNNKYLYLLELSNNLDFIATGILDGELDKMLLITDNNEKEKCQWLVKNDIIYIVYGSFPDKKGKWVLEQMAINFSELVAGKDINNLNKLEKYQIEMKFDGRTKFILQEYLKMQEVFSDQEIPYVEDKLRIDYIGLSSKSIGVISLLLGDELYVELPGEFDNKDVELEMKESVLTAKIEAIAANTIGNTEAMPKWIAVKLKYQQYRFLTFVKYDNDFFLYLLSEGNLGKLHYVETLIRPLIEPVIEKPFTGNLRPYNILKTTLKEIFSERRSFS